MNALFSLSRASSIVRNYPRLVPSTTASSVGIGSWSVPSVQMSLASMVMWRSLPKLSVGKMKTCPAKHAKVRFGSVRIIPTNLGVRKVKEPATVVVPVCLVQRAIHLIAIIRRRCRTAIERSLTEKDGSISRRPILRHFPCRNRPRRVDLGQERSTPTHDR